VGITIISSSSLLHNVLLNRTVDKYLFGSPEPLVIDVLISNTNEDAFEAAFYMVTPPDLQYRKVEQLGEKKDTPISCSAPTPENNHTLKCDIGNPLESGKIVSVPSVK